MKNDVVELFSKSPFAFKRFFLPVIRKLVFEAPEILLKRKYTSNFIFGYMLLILTDVFSLVELSVMSFRVE